MEPKDWAKWGIMMALIVGVVTLVALGKIPSEWIGTLVGLLVPSPIPSGKPAPAPLPAPGAP